MNDIERAIVQLKAQAVCADNVLSINSCNIAISALEKQIPKKPCEVADESGWEDWVCPKCRALIESGSVMLHCWSCVKN